MPCEEGGAAGPAAQAATAMGFGTEGAAFLAAKVGVQATMASTAVGTLNHQGNVFKALEDLGKPASLRNLATSIATAGLTDGLATQLEIPTTELQILSEHARYAAVKAAVSMPLQATLGVQSLDHIFTHKYGLAEMRYRNRYSSLV